jgi:hypothetical protein
MSNRWPCTFGSVTGVTVVGVRGHLVAVEAKDREDAELAALQAERRPVGPGVVAP